MIARVYHLDTERKFMLWRKFFLVAGSPWDVVSADVDIKSLRVIDRSIGLVEVLAVCLDDMEIVRRSKGMLRMI